MRSYGQYCSVAKALDVIGDRWTLLIVRELLVRGAADLSLRPLAERVGSSAHWIRMPRRRCVWPLRSLPPGHGAMSCS